MLNAATVTGTEGNDHIQGRASIDNSLQGLAGDDYLTAGDGDDRLDGGAGNDYLSGWSGSDHYLFNLGGGQDIIHEYYPAVGDLDTVQFGVGISADSVALFRSENNLVIRIIGTSDQLSILDWLDGSDHRIERIQFNDGTTWDAAVIEAKLGSPIVGSADDDNFQSWPGNSDSLIGVNGNDTLSGYEGNDTLDGGAGNDSLIGGAGSDTYIFSLGGGQDRIVDDNSDGSSVNTIQLGFNDGIEEIRSASQFGIRLTGNSLDNRVVGGKGDDTLDGGVGADKMFGGSGDDLYIVDSQADSFVENAFEGNDTLQTTYNNPLASSTTIVLGSGIYTSIENLTVTGTGLFDLMGDGSNNRLTGNTAANTLDGGSGADTLDGGTGNDIYMVDNGGDVVTETSVLVTEIDTVYSSIDYTLGANLENLVLTGYQYPYEGNAYANGTGNDLANRIEGNEADNALQGLSGNDTLIGLDGDDNLRGGEGDDVLDGGTWYDYLDGGAGADLMIGGTGYDTYYVDNVGDNIVEDDVSGDIDTVYLSLASDYVVDANVERLYRNTWNVDVGVSHGNYRTTGNASHNYLYGNLGSDTLEGLGGDDTLLGGFEDGVADYLYGGSGNDIYYEVSVGDVVIELDEPGTDLVRVYGSFAYTLTPYVENGQRLHGGSLTGNGLNNVLTGSAYNDTLEGLSGNDTLNGYGGIDALKGGAGDDVYVVDRTTNVITELAGEGSDTVQSRISFSLANIANVENLTLFSSNSWWSDSPINGTGNNLNNVIIGNNAANRLDGGAGIDTLVGGRGNDTYVVDNLSDQVVEYANEGTDTLESSVSYSLASLNEIENLTLIGSAITGTGNDRNNQIIGNAVANTLEGGAGNDTLNGGAGTDTLKGGLGNDTYIVDSSDVITELAGEGTDTVQSSVNFDLSQGSLSEVENLTLTGSASAGTGNGQGNVIVGNGAVNSLYGNGGDDTLEGGAGDDVLNGGAGSDTARYASATSAVTVNLQTETATGGAGVDMLLSIENVIGGYGNDSILGTAFNNTLDGGLGGWDTLQGGGGDDTYIMTGYYYEDTIIESLDQGIDTVRSSFSFELGANIENLILDGYEYSEFADSYAYIDGTGNGLANVITGNEVVNQIWAGAGNDTLDGRAGVDFLTGGTGSDTYLLGRGHDSDNISEGQSVAGDTDVLQFLPDVSADQLWFSRVGNNLEVSIIGTSDKATISNWYSGDQYHVEQFKTTDGDKTLLDSNVQNLVNAMASFAPPAAGQTTLPQNYQDALVGVIAANWQ